MIDGVNLGELEDHSRKIHWTELAPDQASGVDLGERLDIIAPLDEEGMRCPWPWEPQQLVGVAMGMYHCGYCGTMCLAGVPHVDYRDDRVPDGGHVRSPGPANRCACGQVWPCDYAEQADSDNAAMEDGTAL